MHFCCTAARRLHSNGRRVVCFGASYPWLGLGCLQGSWFAKTLEQATRDTLTGMAGSGCAIEQTRRGRRANPHMRWRAARGEQRQLHENA